MAETDIADLFKYKDELTILTPRGKPTNKKVWVRVLGDNDIKDALRFSRIASSTKRAAMRKEGTPERTEALAQLGELTTEDLKELILAEAENRFITEAPIITEREELPEIEEVATEPDAPTLEEQELLDQKTEDQEKAFLDKINEYVETKKTELKAELDTESDEQLFNRAMKTLENIQPLQAFAEEFGDQKGFRGTFKDKECKVRAFSDIDSFKNAHASLKEQIIAKYNSLEIGSEDLKD